MNRIFSAFTAILLTLSLTACGATKDNTAAPADDPSAAASQDVTVRIGLTGTFNAVSYTHLTLPTNSRV